MNGSKTKVIRKLEYKSDLWRSKKGWLALSLVVVAVTASLVHQGGEDAAPGVQPGRSAQPPARLPGLNLPTTATADAEPPRPASGVAQSAAPSTVDESQAWFERAAFVLECERRAKELLLAVPPNSASALEAKSEPAGAREKAIAEEAQRTQQHNAKCGAAGANEVWLANEQMKRAAAKNNRNAQEYLLRQRTQALLADAMKQAGDVQDGKTAPVLRVNESEAQAIRQELEVLALSGHRPSMVAVAQLEEVNAPSLANPLRATAWRIVESIPSGSPLPTPTELARANDGVFENLSGEQVQQVLKTSLEIYARCCSSGVQTSGGSGSKPQ